MLLEDVHRLAHPLGCGGRRALRLGNERLRAEDGVAVAKEDVRVGHALIGLPGDAPDRLTAAQVLEREHEGVDLDPVTGGDQRGRVLLVLAVARAASHPEAVLAPLGGTERSEGTDVTGAYVLAVTERLEDRPARELVGAVAEHR